MEEKIIEYIRTLFSSYGYWALALVGATFALMIPINILIKTLFKKAKSTETTRLRKTLSAVAVYVVAGGVLACANLILRAPFDIKYILVSCVPVGGLAMVMWAVFKFTRDLGFSWLVKMLAKSKTIKEKLKSLPLDNDVAMTIYNKLVELVKESKGENSQIVEKKQVELLEMASSMLNGFVEADRVSSTATGIVDALKLKFQNK